MLSNVGTFLSHAEKWARENAIKEQRARKNTEKGMYVQFCSQYTADVATDYLMNLYDLTVS